MRHLRRYASPWDCTGSISASPCCLPSSIPSSRCRTTSRSWSICIRADRDVAACCRVSACSRSSASIPRCASAASGATSALNLRPEGFQAGAGRCRGVIGNAGFELASEALSLGKKLLVKPLGGQFEQLTNSGTLELMGLAQLMDSLDANTVQKLAGGPFSWQGTLSRCGRRAGRLVAGRGRGEGRSPAASGAGLSFRRRCVTAWELASRTGQERPWLSQLSAFD